VNKGAAFFGRSPDFIRNRREQKSTSKQYINRDFCGRKKSRRRSEQNFSKLKTAHCLLSHQSYTEVSSAVLHLTSEFGKGSGRATALETRGGYSCQWHE